jgi:hypothetical protein
LVEIILDKIELLGQINSRVGTKYNLNENSIKSFNSKYRKYKDRIFSVMSFDTDEIDCFRLLLLKRSNELKIIIKSITCSVDERKVKLIVDIIHMHVNRMIIQKAPTHEVILYYFMDKFYLSLNAIQKST